MLNLSSAIPHNVIIACLNFLLLYFLELVNTLLTRSYLYMGSVNQISLWIYNLIDVTLADISDLWVVQQKSFLLVKQKFVFYY